MKLSGELFEDTGIEMFRESLTLASFVNRVYRSPKFYNNNLAITPKHGFRLADIQSEIASKFLIYYKRNFVPADALFHSAFHGREKVIIAGGKRYKVDGYFETKTDKHVIEFQGCFFHDHQGCPLNKCRPMKNSGRKNSDMIGSLKPREYTEQKLRDLTTAGFNVLTVWECEFKNYLKENGNLKNDLTNEIKLAKLELRDAFAGGNVDAVCLMHECKPNQRILYVDFCSLYPYINAKAPNAIGVISQLDNVFKP